MNKYIKENSQNEAKEHVIHDIIPTYISNKEGETEACLKCKKGYGILSVELGNTNIAFKIEDLKKIIGDEKQE